MDTTKQYVNMCNNAEEIQKNHEWCEMDLFWAINMEEEIETLNPRLPKKLAKILNRDLALGLYTNKHLICEFCGEENGLYPFDKFFPVDEVIWLPRQDQLQEMISQDKHERFFLGMADHDFPDWVVYKDLSLRFNACAGIFSKTI